MAIRERATGRAVTAVADECRRCGCRDFRKIGRSRFCRYCGKAAVMVLRPVAADAAAPGDPEPNDAPAVAKPVIFTVVRCPECGSRDNKVTSTRRPTRYHKCKSCSHNFKSTEG